MYLLDPNQPLTTKTVNGISNVVTELNWYYEDTVDGRTYKVHGAKIELPEPEASSFVEFNILTEDIVNGWINDLLTTEEKEWYVGQIAAHQQTARNIHARWVTNRDLWDAEQQEKLDSGDIEEMIPYEVPEPTWGDSLDIFCEAPKTTEQAFPWA